MSKALIDKLRKAREQNVPINGHTFTIRRPTEGDLRELKSTDWTLELATRFVVGWNLKEIDFDSGGTDEPVPFDPLLWAEYVRDHGELWEALGQPMIEAYKKHKEETENAKKN